MISGGGARNSHLMKRIEAQLEKRVGYHVHVCTHEAFGINSDAKGKKFIN